MTVSGRFLRIAPRKAFPSPIIPQELEMNRRLLHSMAMLIVLSAGISAPLAAQSQVNPREPKGSFRVGYTDIGPTIGLGGIGDAGVSFGGRFERALQTLPSLGNGVLGLQASFDYYSYDNSFAGTDYGFTYTPIGVTGNYHFQLDDKRIDPFVGLGLGYLRVSTKWDGDVSSSGVYFIGRAGVRYFMKPNMALYADAGAGAATVSVGMTFGFGGD